MHLRDDDPLAIEEPFHDPGLIPTHEQELAVTPQRIQPAGFKEKGPFWAGDPGPTIEIGLFHQGMVFERIHNFLGQPIPMLVEITTIRPDKEIPDHVLV